jgi:hypothetical protein
VHILKIEATTPIILSCKGVSFAIEWLWGRKHTKGESQVVTKKMEYDKYHGTQKVEILMTFFSSKHKQKTLKFACQCFGTQSLLGAKIFSSNNYMKRIE